MGLLDQLAGTVMGATNAQQQDPVPQGNLIGGVMGMIDSAGGLPALLQKLKDSGLQDQVASWIGTGANQPVSSDQIEQALGEDQIQQIAQQAGVAPEQATSGLAQLLPQVIDKLTPGGELPNNDVVAQGLNMLKGKLFG